MITSAMIDGGEVDTNLYNIGCHYRLRFRDAIFTMPIAYGAPLIA